MRKITMAVISSGRIPRFFSGIRKITLFSCSAPPASLRGLLGHCLAVFRGGEVPRQKTGIAKFPLDLFVRPGVLIYCKRERALLGAAPSNRRGNPFGASCDENHLVSESQVHGYPRRLKNPPSMG